MSKAKIGRGSRARDVRVARMAERVAKGLPLFEGEAPPRSWRDCDLASYEGWKQAGDLAFAEPLEGE